MRRNVFLAIGALLAVGCAPNNPGLTIDGILAPSEMCEFNSSSAFLVEPVLDTADIDPRFRPTGIRYIAVIRASNHLINRMERIYPLMADPDYMNIEAAEIEVLSTDGSRLDFGGNPNPYRVPAAGFIASATSNTPEVGLITVEVLPRVYGDTLVGLDGEIILSVRLVGVTSGGSTVISSRAVVPIRLCNHCLFACTTDSMGAPVISLGCTPGQDGFSSVCP